MIEKIRLCDVCDFQGGSQPPKDEWSFEQKDGYIRMLQIRDFTQTRNVEKEYIKLTSSTKTCEADDILIARYGASVGKILTGLSGAYNVAIMKTIPNERLLNKSYLKYYLLSDYFQSRINSVGERAAQAGFNKEDLSKLLISLVSLEEQKRIADELDKVSNLIDKRKQQLSKLDELVKARFVELFGDPILNQKGFSVYRMDEVVEFQGGSQPDKKYFEYEPTEDNIRLIQIRDYKTDKYITYIPKSMAKRFCTADDIMIGRYGPPIFQILQGIEGSFNVALMKATPKMGNKKFIRQFLKQDCLLEYLEGLSKRTAGQDGIQMDKLKAYPFPMPPIELQEGFEQFIKQTDKSKLEIQKSLGKLELLKKALMQKYFG